MAGTKRENGLLIWANVTRPKVVHFLLNHGADLNMQNESGFTLLHHAVLTACLHSTEAIKSVKLLINGGSNIDVKETRRSLSPLMMAVSLGNEEVVELLLKNNADCNSLENNGYSPLLISIKSSMMPSKRLNIMRMLLEHGANFKIKCNKDLTAIHHAALFDNIEMLEFVLDHAGLHVDVRQCNGPTPLHMAVLKGFAENCALLLKRGADVNAKWHEGEHAISLTPLDVAIQYEHIGVLKLLLKHGAKLTYYSLNTTNFNDEQDTFFILLRHLANDIEENQQVGDYYIDCAREFQITEQIKIFEDITLCDIMMKSKTAMSGLARNAELVRSFKSKTNNYDKFPKLFDLATNRFNEAINKQRMLMTATTQLNKILYSQNLNNIIIETILNFLSVDELKHFVTSMKGRI